MRVYIVLLAIIVSFASNAAESWLQIVKSKDGFLFNGPKSEEYFSFNVVGKTIQTADDRGRAFAGIDGNMVQTMLYPISELPKGDPLAEYRKYETEYLKTLGADISKSNSCPDLKIPHQEWRAILPKVSTSTYLIVKLRRSVLIIVVAYNSPMRSAIADQQLTSICKSLKV